MGMGFGGIMRSWMVTGSRGRGCYKSVNCTYTVAFFFIDVCYI